MHYRTAPASEQAKRAAWAAARAAARAPAPSLRESRSEYAASLSLSFDDDAYSIIEDVQRGGALHIEHGF